MSRISWLRAAGRYSAASPGPVQAGASSSPRTRAARAGLEGEPEGLGSGQRHGHAVGHDRLVSGVAVGPEVLDPTGDRVGVRGGWDPALPKDRARPWSRQRHPPPGLQVVAVADGVAERAASSRMAFSDHMSEIGLDPQ